jgi:hypothetical protein
MEESWMMEVVESDNFREWRLLDDKLSIIVLLFVLH